MAIKILTDGKTFESVMYDESTEIAFGPVFGTDEDPAEFMEWFKGLPPFTQKVGILGLIARDLSELVDRWRTQTEENENEARSERYYSDTARTTLLEQMEKARKLK